MRRHLIAITISLACAPATALAQDAPPAEAEDEYEEPLPEIGEDPGEDVGERELGASVGALAGGGVSPGGLRFTVDYLYQLSDLDWFDGIMQFTFGSGDPRCFRDRADELVCDHGVASGAAIDLAAGVRRFFAGRDGFRPWARPAVGVRLTRFPDDDLTGAGIFLSAGGGVRVRVTDTLAVGGSAALEVGASLFSRGMGPRLQMGLTVAATVEFALP